MSGSLEGASSVPPREQDSSAETPRTPVRDFTRRDAVFAHAGAMITEQEQAPARAGAANRRASPRQVLVRYVWIQGRDERFGRFEQDAFTLEISDRGLRLGGVYRNCIPGSTMVVSTQGRSARYRVVWMAARDSPFEGQCGLQRVEADEALFPDLERRVAGGAIVDGRNAGEVLAQLVEWFGEHDVLSREEFERLRRM